MKSKKKKVSKVVIKNDKNIEEEFSSEYRTRNYVIIIYPDSAPANFIEIISELCVPAFLSPLHDKDMEDNGKLKKPHYHLLLMFKGPKSLNQIKEISNKLSGVLPMSCMDLRGKARYLCHLDSYDKAQYPISEVRSFAGADYYEIINLASDKYQAIKEMLDYCENNGIYEFCDLLIYASEENFGWYRVLCDSGAFVVKEYLKSKKYKLRDSVLFSQPKKTDCTIFVNNDKILPLENLNKT